jgi:hypothetical protein
VSGDAAGLRISEAIERIGPHVEPEWDGTERCAPTQAELAAALGREYTSALSDCLEARRLRWQRVHLALRDGVLAGALSPGCCGCPMATISSPT